ncbi:hypothetical protein LPJ73_002461, partial [Coemansia sp. RSA 2703]
LYQSNSRHAESLRRGPVMRASLFAPPPATTKRELAESLVAQASKATSRSSFSLLTASAQSGPQDAQRASHQKQAGIDHMPPPSKYLRTNEMRFAREMLAARRPYAESLSHGRSGVSADAGLMMARSFRVAFGPQGQLVYLAGSQIVVDNVAHHLHAASDGNSAPATQSDSQAESDAMITDDDDSGCSDNANCTSFNDHCQLQLAMVQAQWEHAQITSSTVGCPLVTFRAETSIASVLKALESLQPENLSDVVSTAFDNERRILELASALFDELPVEPGQEELSREQLSQIQSVRRRQALTSWLMSAVYDSAQQDLLRAGQSSSPSAASVFALLSGHQIDHACLAATSYRDYRLATLIAQCGAGAVGGGGNDRQVRELIRAHVERFAATGSGNDLKQEYRRVYELLSGNVKWESKPVKDSGDERVFVAQGVDWKRAFALGLWYAQLPADPVSDAVTLYEDMVDGDMPVAPPLPCWFYECVSDMSLVKKSISQLKDLSLAQDLFSRRVWDPVFQLLKLYSRPTYPLERALISESFSPARADARFPTLLAWLLSTVLKMRGFDDSVPANGGTSLAYDWLLTSWAHQLECLGMWHWSCYLLLQLSSPDVLKENAIRSLIERSLQTSEPNSSLVPLVAGELIDAFELVETDEKIDFVVNDLHLPVQWLYDAYTTRCRYECDWDFSHTTNTTAEAILRQIGWLINAGQYSSAHMLVMQRIAPYAILDGEYDLLKRILDHLDPTLVADRVPLEQWESGGRVFSLFLSTVRDLPAILNRMANDDDQSDMNDGLQQIELVYEQMQVLLSTLPSLSARFSMSPASNGFYNGTCTYWYTCDELSELKIKYLVAVSDMASVITGFIQEIASQVPGLAASSVMNSASANTANLPLAQDMRIMRIYQMARTCFNSLIGDKLSA